MIPVPFLILGAGALLGGGYALTRKKPDLKGKVTPERQVILQTALATETDPVKLKTLATAFAQQGLPAQAAQLQAKAAVPVTNTQSGPSAQQLAAAAAATAAAQQKANQFAAQQQIAQDAAVQQAAQKAATAQRAVDAANQNAAAALAAQQADAANQAAVAAASQQTTSQQIVSAITDPLGNQLLPISGPTVTLQEQINQATESGGGILRAIVGNLPSIQMALNAVMGVNLDIDGKKGPMTLKAIKDFQASQSLSQDGDPGPQTVKALNSKLGVA